MADFDDIELSGLTAAQLEELSELIDPDNEMLPAADRMPVHTKKKATGPFDRSHLLDHLKTQATNSTIGEDYVPFTKKQTQSKPVEKRPAKVKKKTEFDDMLEVLDPDDLAELAAELGIHGLVDQAMSRGDEQPIAAVQCGLSKPGSGYSYQSSPQQHFEDLSEEVDVEDAITRLTRNDRGLTELNLNNHTKLDSDLIEELIVALTDNIHLERLQMANIRFSEDHAFTLAEVLKVNSTLMILNLESNRITRKGIKAIFKALSENTETGLKELRLTNQYFSGGAGAEGEIARYLDKNRALTKLGYNFTVASFRTKVDAFIMRNIDYARKKRASGN
ncbi:tropomodulin-2-like [Halichondria panicea]|uniref:tropomodulin-2-like n=1 Tax=Halichondria panicea TaxID=6063 RepID=UPI00312B2D7A